MTNLRPLAVVAALSLPIAACSGGGASTPAGAVGSSHSKQRAAVAIKLKVAAPRKTAARRHALFLDSATTALVISADGAQVANLPINGTTCPGLGGTTSVTCNLTAALPLGAHAFLFQAVPTTAAEVQSGPQHDSAAVVAADVTAAGPNIIHVVLGGVLNSLLIVPGSNGDVPSGAALSVPLAVVAKDLDGNQIIGSDPFVADDGVTPTPITVTTSNAKDAALQINGGTPGASVSVTSPADSVKIVYSGAPNVVATLAASFPSFGVNIAYQAAAAFIGGGGFRPVVTVYPGDSQGQPYTAIAASTDGTGLLVAESDGSIVVVSASGTLGRRISLASSGAGGESIVVRAMANIKGRILAIGDNSTGSSSSNHNIYALDLTSLDAPIIRGPVVDNVNGLQQSLYLNGSQAVSSDGRLWIAPGNRYDTSQAAASSIYSVDASLTLHAYPVPDTAASGADVVTGICAAADGTSIGFLESGPQTGGAIDLTGRVLGEYTVDSYFVPTACVGANDGAFWLTDYQVTLNGAAVLDRIPGNALTTVQPITGIAGFAPGSGYYANGIAVAGTTPTNSNNIYWIDSAAFSSLVNFVTFDTVAHVATNVAVPGNDIAALMIAAPDGNLWFVGDTGAGGSNDIVHVQVHQ